MKKLIEVTDIQLETWIKMLDSTKKVIEKKWADATILTHSLVEIRGFLTYILEKTSAGTADSTEKLQDLVDEMAEEPSDAISYDPKHYKHVRAALEDGRIKEEKE